MATATCLAVKLHPDQRQQRRLELEKLYEQQFWTKWEQDESGRAIRSRHRQQPAETADVPEIEKLIHGEYYPKSQSFPPRKKKSHHNIVQRNILKYSNSKPPTKALSPSDSTSSASASRLYEQLRWANHRRKPLLQCSEGGTSHLTAAELLYHRARASAPPSTADAHGDQPEHRRPCSAPGGCRAAECEIQPSSTTHSRRRTSLASAIEHARHHRLALHESLRLAAAGSAASFKEEREQDDEAEAKGAVAPAAGSAEAAVASAGSALRHAMKVHVPDTLHRKPKADRQRPPLQSGGCHQPLVVSHDGSTFAKDGSILIATHLDRRGVQQPMLKGVHHHSAVYR